MKNFLKRGARPPEVRGEADGLAAGPTPDQTRPPAEEPPPSDPASKAKPSETHPVALALAMHQASSLPALVDAATAIAARQFDGALLLILLKGHGENLTLASGASELTADIHTQINRAFGSELAPMRVAITGPLLAAVTGEPAVGRMSSLAELLGQALGDEACQEAQAKLKTKELIVVRLSHMGKTEGLAMYLMTRPQADLDTAKALVDNFAVALANLRERDEARRYGTIDPIRWVSDEERFIQELNREASRAARYDAKFAVLLLVVRNLEKLRAEFGPSQADRLLRAVGATLSRELRASDTLAAYREDGFGLILPETEKDKATSVANRLRDLASQVSIFGSDASAPRVECAVAEAVFPEDGKTAVELAAAAESRLLGLDWPLPKTGSD